MARAASPLSPPSSLEDSSLDVAAADGAEEDVPDLVLSLAGGSLTDGVTDLEEDAVAIEVVDVDAEGALKRGSVDAASSLR